MVRFSCKEHSVTILKTMFDLKKYADVEIISGMEEKSILAHKSVLSSASEYFEVMFSSSFREAAESKVTLKDIEPNVLEAIINYFYCGFIDISDAETAIKLMKNAHLMKVPVLMKHSAEYLKTNITIQTCLEMLLLAKQYEENDLLDEVSDFIVTKFEEVSKLDEFQILDINSLVDIISARNDSTSEDVLAKGVLDWIGKDEEREKHFKELLYLLQIESINQKELVDQIQAQCTEKEDVDYVMEGLKKRIFGKPKATVPKLNTNKLHVLIKGDNHSEVLKLCEYDFNSRQYGHKEKVHNYGRPIGIYEEKIVLLVQHNTILVYDRIERITSPPMTCHYQSGFLGLTKIGNFIYLLTETAICQFDLDKSDTVYDSFKRKYVFDAFCKCDNKLKVLVHEKHNPDLLIVYDYDPKLNFGDEWTWEQTTVITNSVEPGFAVHHDNAIYYFKGCFLHIYHLEDKTWDTHNHLKFPDPCYKEITEASSINGKLLLTINNKIYECRSGTGIQQLILPGNYSGVGIIPLL